MPMTAPAPTAFLDACTQTLLIADAQDVPVECVEEDGTERIIYGSTPASERAFEQLTAAFWPAIRKATRTAKMLDEDDAEAAVLAEFVDAIRRFDVWGSDIPFSATISTILIRAISDLDRTSDLITVKENVAARYWRLMHKHGGDVGAAYDECETTANGFDPVTFLAVHRAIGGYESLDALVDDGISSFVGSGETPFIALEDALEAEWLFAQVTDRQETILRALFGFRDIATESLVVTAGLRPGEPLSDVQVGGVIDVPRSTVQREKRSGLSSMRAALQGLVDDESEDE